MTISAIFKGLNEVVNEGTYWSEVIAWWLDVSTIFIGGH